MQIDTSTIEFMAQGKIPSVKKDAEDQALKQQTDQFEALLLKTLLDTSMKNENPLFGKDAGDKIYQSMYRDEISKMSSGSFGLSEMLFNYLKQNR